MVTFIHSRSDMKWLFDTHCKHVKNRSRYRSAMITGNEDAPQKVELYASSSPSIHDTPKVVIDNYLPCDYDGVPTSL